MRNDQNKNIQIEIFYQFKYNKICYVICKNRFYFPSVAVNFNQIYYERLAIDKFVGAGTGF